MFEQITKSRVVASFAIAFGVIGACGQAYLLYHELVNCLPYKEMDGDFYERIAVVGVISAPLIAISAGFLLARRRFWLATVGPVVLCPLIFAGIFEIFSLLRVLSGVADSVHWDGRNSSMVALEFFQYTLSLAGTGLVVGGICSFLLFLILRVRDNN
jgi:hypothetical protein